MNTKFSISNAISIGWELVMRYKFQFILATILIWISTTVFTRLEYFGDFSLSTTLLLSILSIIIGFFLQLGITKNALLVNDGKPFTWSAFGTMGSKFLPAFLANIIVNIIIGIGLIFLIIPGIYLSMRLSMVITAIVDEDMGPFDAIAYSWNLTRNQAWPLFLFTLCSLGIMIIGIICLFIGFFIACPIIYIAQAYIYRKLQANEDPQTI